MNNYYKDYYTTKYKSDIIQYTLLYRGQGSLLNNNKLPTKLKQRERRGSHG